MTPRKSPASGTSQRRAVCASIELPTHWSAKQACAVFEILDELRERVWEHYGPKIQKAMREDHSTTTSFTPSDIDQRDFPF